MDTFKLLYKLIILYDDYTTKVKYYEKELINRLRGDEINDN